MVNDGGFETLARAISSQYLLNNLSLNFHRYIFFTIT